MVSHSPSTTDRLCSTIRMVRLARMLRINSTMRSTSPWFMPAVGSSSNIICGIERQRGGDFERPLLPIGKQPGRRVGDAGQSDVEKQLMRPVVIFPQHRFTAPEVEGIAARPLQRQTHILEHRKFRKHRRNLEAAHQAEPRHVGRLHLRDVPPLEKHRAAGGLQKFRQQVETGGLSGPVRTDQRVDRPGANRKGDVVNGDKAVKFLGKSRQFPEWFRSPANTSLRS